MKRLVLLASYLFLLPLIILSFSFFILFFSREHKDANSIVLRESGSFDAIQERPITLTHLIETQEARVGVLESFFKRYNSPLFSYAQKMVEVSDKCSLDWRLLPAIAMQESNLCNKIPKNSHNCWGFGIYSGKVTRFDNYDQAIETVTKTLAKDYKEKRGLTQPHEIVTRYTPGNTGSWAHGVNFFMDKIQSSL